jgi:peptidoglycan-N-acetylglucosamine deacetylase
MKFLLLNLLVLLAFNSFAQLKYLPRHTQYSNSDTGYTQYNTPSLLNNNQYVLTFDDGPHITRTPLILDILKKYNVRATFFVISSLINKQTAPLLKRMINEGHIIANHGVDHFNSNTITEEKFLSNIRDNFLKVNKTLKRFNINLDKFYYRFPYAAYGRANNYHHLNSLRDLSLSMFNKNCIHFVFWDHDSADWVPTLTPSELLTNVKAFQFGGEYFTYKLNAQRDIIKIKKNDYIPTKGGVILFHDIQKRTVNALDSILSFFQTNNIEVMELGKTREYSERDFSGCHLD